MAHPTRKRALSALVGLLAAASLGGCQFAGLVAGEGMQDALFKFDKKQRVVVLVDVAETVTPPPSFAVNLADKIGAHLLRYNATGNLVPESSVLDLQQRDPAKFRTMSLADVARSVDADAVLYVRLTELDVMHSEESAVTEGFGEAFVKVVDRNGTRLYPGGPLGTKISAHVPAGLTSDQDVPTVQRKMLDQIALLTGRMFHSYSLDNKEMLESGEDRKVIGP